MRRNRRGEWRGSGLQRMGKPLVAVLFAQSCRLLDKAELKNFQTIVIKAPEEVLQTVVEERQALDGAVNGRVSGLKIVRAENLLRRHRPFAVRARHVCDG